MFRGLAAAARTALAIGGLALALAGCSTSGPTPVTEAATGEAGPVQPYKIGPQDVLDISVYNVPDLSRTVQVAGNGVINYPLVGDVPAAGRTAHEIEGDIAERLNKRYVRSPSVTVFVKEFNSQHYTIDGAVKKPGVFPVRDHTTLMDALATAGGLDMEYSGSALTIFRKSENGTQNLRFDIDAIRKGATATPGIENGDYIVVDTSDGKVFLNGIGKISPVTSLMRPVVP